MPKTLHARKAAQPGGKMEIDSRELEAGQVVDVTTGSTDYCTKYGMGVGCRLGRSVHRRR